MANVRRWMQLGMVASVIVFASMGWSSTCSVISLSSCRAAVRFVGGSPLGDRFNLRCNVALDGASDGIDPVAEGITLLLTDADSPVCTAPCFAATVTPRRIGRCWRYTAPKSMPRGLRSLKVCEVDAAHGLYRLTAKGRDDLQCLNTAAPYAVGLTIGNDCTTDCGFATTTTTSTSTTSTSTSTTSTSTMPTVPACCGPERVRLVSSFAGTMKLSGFAPFPMPVGIVATIDASTPTSDCRHDLVIPAGGFTMPSFCLPAFAATVQTYATGCAAGDGDGNGVLWDARAGAHGGVPDTNVTTSADSSDGLCDVGLGTCADRDNNTMGNVDVVHSVGGSGNRTGFRFDVPTHTRVWQDAEGCPGNGIYNPAEGDSLEWEWDAVVSPTTGTATGQFVDQNLDGCALPTGSSGYGAPSAQCAAGSRGPCTVTGVEMPGPCCTVGQNATMAFAGMGFSNSFPLYDLGFLAVIPTTVSSCGPAVGGSCTSLTGDPCRE